MPAVVIFYRQHGSNRDMAIKTANGLVQLIAGSSNYRVEATVIGRSGTRPAGRRAGRVPSLLMFAIHPPRQPAIPDDGRSQTI